MMESSKKLPVDNAATSIPNVNKSLSTLFQVEDTSKITSSFSKSVDVDSSLSDSLNNLKIFETSSSNNIGFEKKNPLKPQKSFEKITTFSMDDLEIMTTLGLYFYS